MKVTAPNDLDGRQSACIDRAKLIAETLYAFVHGTGDIEPMSEGAMRALSQISDELAVEVMAIRDRYVDEANNNYRDLLTAREELKRVRREKTLGAVTSSRHGGIGRHV